MAKSLGANYLNVRSLSTIQAQRREKIAGHEKNSLPPLFRAEYNISSVSSGLTGCWKAPEFPAKYPEYSMFGVLPAYGFYCRHAVGLRFENVEVDFVKKDHRPALVCEDVANLELAGWKGRVGSQMHAPAPAQEPAKSKKLLGLVPVNIGDRVLAIFGL